MLSGPASPGPGCSPLSWPPVHVAEALHGRHVALDALFRDVQLGDKGQAAVVVVVKEHGAAIVASSHDAVL